MRYDFSTAGRIVFGPDTWKEVGPAALEMGRSAFVVSGRSPDRVAPLLEELEAQGIDTAVYRVTEEPTVEIVREGVQNARDARSEVVIGFGGGSVVDTAKAVATLLTNGGDPLDYLEVIGSGKPITEPAAPTIAVPTTAGTGAEVTRNAVLASHEHRVKVSLRSRHLLPRLSVVDPTLTHSVPPDVTASTGLDALTQVIEPYVSKHANPLTDALCREGIRRGGRSLRRAYENGDDADAREDMALTSLFGGLALANAKLGAVHGFAGVLGGMFGAPHGVICGRLLPHVTTVNVRALRERNGQDDYLERYNEVAKLLIGSPQASAKDGIAWLQALCETLDVPPLSEYGVAQEDFPEIIEKSSQSSSMKGNPVTLTREEMEDILERAL